MAQHMQDEVAYYYDLHPTEEDLMGESAVHAALVRYLVEVLTWLFRGHACSIHENLNFYQTPQRKEHPLAPDIAVIKGVPFAKVPSWHVGTTGPAPQVVFEIASKETWDIDLGEKVDKYGRMGVQEYFAYDPNLPLLKRDTAQRLFGWQLERRTRSLQPLAAGPGGRMWSGHLNSFLVPDADSLRLYDSKWQLCLTQGEAEALRAEAEAEARRAADRRAEAEAEARRAADRRSELERQRAEAEARRAQALAEKMRSLGIDPEQI